MSDPVIRRALRAVEEAIKKPGMRAGMAKVTIDAADASRLCLLSEKALLMGQQLDQALAEAESLRGRCGELELAVVHTKEVCAESLKRVVACWREDGVSGEHSNVANAYEDFIGGLPSASAWLLRRQAETLEAEADEWSDDEMTYSGRKVKQELLDSAQRLRGEVDDAAAN